MYKDIYVTDIYPKILGLGKELTSGGKLPMRVINYKT